MTTYDEANAIVDACARPLPSEARPVRDASGYFLADDVISLLDSPRFDNSAVDGYALHDTVLTSGGGDVVFEVPAGALPPRELGIGEAARVFTGAPLPLGTAAVAMQEDCRVEGARLSISSTSQGDHIRRRGEDFSAGSSLLLAHTFLGPSQAAIVASSGLKEISVFRKPRVGILTSGNEIAPIDAASYGELVPNSNAYGLSSACSALSVEPIVRHASDDVVALNASVSDLLANCDVLLTCGGVSVGSYDYLKDVFAEVGVEQRFWGVAIKPGKPIYFGVRGDKLIFGLPGNPVSALVTYFLFARPAILKRMGHPDPWPKPVRARFRGSARKQPGRMEFLRGRLSQKGTESVVETTGEQGSHQLAALAAADCLIHVPLEASELTDGEVVEVTKLNWGLA